MVEPQGVGSTGTAIPAASARLGGVLLNSTLDRRNVVKRMLGLLLMTAIMAPDCGAAEGMPNRLIDYDSFASQVPAVGLLRKARRLSEAEFIRMSQEPDSVILDARSKEKYRLLHVKGAKNLSLPDITAEELAKIIPAKSSKILIYCNNNFLNEPEAFPSKAPAASLNIHTFNALYSYGYQNVYELGPLIDISKAALSFEGTKRDPRNAQPASGPVR